MCLQVAVLMQQFKDAKFSAIICMDAMRAPSNRLDQVSLSLSHYLHGRHESAFKPP